MSSALDRLIAVPPDVVQLGVEHEYRVVRDGEQVDFRLEIHLLGLGQRRLDPGDANAYRLPSGAKLTCDEAEAEIALPPIRVGPGFAREARSAAGAERSALQKRLGDVRLEGHSMHVSVSVPDALLLDVARMFTERFALTYVGMTDRSDMPGVAVRLRPGRLELCGEFLEGRDLERACVIAAANVQACICAITEPHGAAVLPPAAADMDIRPIRDRFGWFVMGADRDPEHIEAAWACARDAAQSMSPAEFDAVETGTDGASGDGPDDVPLRHLHTPFGNVLAARERPGFAVAPVMATWDLTIFMVVAGRRPRRRFVSVPSGYLDSFLTELDAGRLDAVLPRGRAVRRLRRREQAGRPAIFRRICPRAELLPRDRDASLQAFLDARVVHDG